MNGDQFVDEVLGLQLIGAITEDIDTQISLTFETEDGTWRDFSVYAEEDDAGYPMLTFKEDAG